MKWELKKNLHFIIFLLAFMIMSVFAGKHVQASLSDSVNATVKISICGNEITESGEDCDNADLDSRTCVALGYSSGNLACDISCSFETSPCEIPSITPTNIAPSELASLLPAGYFTISNTDSVIATSSLTTTSQLTINIPASGGTNSIVLPDNLVITKSGGTNFDPTDLTTADVSTSSLSGFSSGITADGAVQFGISSTTLEFDSPITINIYVGTSLNGETLNVVRSVSLDSGWTSDGIVSPATCTVSSGLCTFQATKASYFATNRTVAATPTPTPTATPTPTTTASSSSSSTTSSGGNTITGGSSTVDTASSLVSALTVPSLTVIPAVLQHYVDFLDRNGKIKMSNLFNVVTNWVDDWKEVVIAITNGEDIETKGRKCDVNGDGRCDIKDLSVLLFYVEK